MGLKLENLQTLTDHRFDDVIDVRSPAEYAEDHVPGAVNLSRRSWQALLVVV